MTGQRWLRVRFEAKGSQVVEDYGPFTSTQQLVAWLDKHESEFGAYAVIEIRRLGMVDVNGRGTATTTRKKVTAS